MTQRFWRACLLIIATCLARPTGFIMFDGGLHIRGACIQPKWHSLRKAWEGEFALHLLYPTVGRKCKCQSQLLTQS